MTAPFLLLEKRERGIIKKTVNTGKRGGKKKKFFYKRKKLCILIGMYLLFLLFVSQDAWLYDTTIAKITKVQTEKTGEKEAVRGDKEAYYRQTMQGLILNGKWKGSKITLKNEYTYSGVTNQKYHKGDKVFIHTSENGEKLSGKIKGLKRDTYLAAVGGMLLLLLILITKKQGIYTISTMIFNTAVYAVGFHFYLKGGNMIEICNIMVLCFTFGTIFLLNGFHKRTWAAVCSTLCVFAVIMGIFHFVIYLYGDVDYSSMEYLGSVENPAQMFEAEVMLAGLGAIMDVAVTIAAATGELIRKKPDIKFLPLFRSGREIGYDIMGTMISVLLFTFGSGLIPGFLIRMNNDISFLSNIRYHISFEICRFLIESIGIVLAIPISIFVSAVFLKVRFRREK